MLILDIRWHGCSDQRRRRVLSIQRPVVGIRVRTSRKPVILDMHSYAMACFPWPWTDIPGHERGLVQFSAQVVPWRLRWCRCRHRMRYRDGRIPLSGYSMDGNKSGLLSSGLVVRLLHLSWAGGWRRLRLGSRHSQL